MQNGDTLLVDCLDKEDAETMRVVRRSQSLGDMVGEIDARNTGAGRKGSTAGRHDK